MKYFNPSQFLCLIAATLLLEQMIQAKSWSQFRDVLASGGFHSFNLFLINDRRMQEGWAEFHRVKVGLKVN